MALTFLVWILVLAPPDEPEPSERVRVAPTVGESESESESEGEVAPDAPETGAFEQPDAPTEPAPRRSWQAQLFIDVAYGFNSNRPDNHVYRGMYTNPRTNELAVHNVGAFVRHRLSEREPWSFELGLHAGAAVDALTASEPIPGGPDGKFAGAQVFKYIALANAGFELPRAKTQIAAGVFESPLGIGSFWTFNNYNYTTSWESNVVPYYLTGAKISQPLPGGVELAGWLVNGFQSYADLNSVPSGLVTLTWARGPTPAPSPRTGDTALTLSTQVYFGPERTTIAAKDWLVYWDTWAMWDFDDHFSLGAVWDLSVDRAGRGSDLQELYTGGALFVRGTVHEGKHTRVDLALRPEASWDRDGRFFGVDQWLVSGTATANLWLYDHLLLRAEYRYDLATGADGFFYRHEAGSDTAAGLAGDQHLVFLALTAWWDFWFGARDLP